MNERRLPFPERLRYERERRGWSLADLAAKIGVNTNTIGRWERGESLPRSYPLSRLATLFGMSTEELTLMPALGEQSSLSSATPRYIEFAIEQGDITSFDADIVALKFAQDFYGVDKTVALRLSQVGTPVDTLRPTDGEYRYIETNKAIKAHHVLLVGVPDLYDFGYQEIREFSARVLTELVNVAPYIEHLAMTIHGVGYGLDEVEVILAQFAGYMDAIQIGHLPHTLERITIVEINPDRVQRLRQALDKSLDNPNYDTKVGIRWSYQIAAQQSKGSNERPLAPITSIETAGTESLKKPHIFVAMPFSKEMDDVFYYGIQQPVHAAGFLCERVDQVTFLGDILNRIMERIETAAIVIAELSGANPNVYLEVGYAWGKGRPTILLTKDAQELRFDVRSQRCLKYERIKDLEEALNKELKDLKVAGII